MKPETCGIATMVNLQERCNFLFNANKMKSCLTLLKSRRFHFPVASAVVDADPETSACVIFFRKTKKKMLNKRLQ